MRCTRHPTQRRAGPYGRALIAALIALVICLPALAADPAARVVDINAHQTMLPPAPNDSSTPQHLITIGTTLYFSADDGSSGRELWKSDGTAGNASLIKNIEAGSAGSDPAELTAFNGALFFTADDGSGRTIWNSDGLTSGTTLVTNTSVFSAAADLTTSGNALYFSATSATSGRELWKIDGTPLGATLVKEINPGTASAAPTDLADVNGTLFFAATEGISNTELWKSDGTITGTVKVKDINPGVLGSPGSFPNQLTNVNGTLFFAADDGVSGIELWKSDGTITGTIQLKDINASFPGAASSPAHLLAIGNKLFFTANDGVHGEELWVSDGTSAGTTLTRDIYAGTFDSTPSNLTDLNGTLYFTANDGVSGIELWKSDGTAAGTVQVKDIYPGAPDSSPSHLANMNGTLLFAANDGINGVELWKSKGTLETTLLVQNIANGAGASDPAEFTRLGSTVFFRATDDVTGAELWSLPLSGLNFAPIAGNTTVSTSVGAAVSGTLPVSDPDSNPLVFSIVTNGATGSATITNAATGAFTYTPNAAVTGTDSFTFKASDGQVDSNIATVTVTIGAPNGPPVAANATITIAFNLQFSGTLGAADPEHSALIYSIVTNGSKGVARITDPITGAFTYTPNAGGTGSDSFTFKASDGQVDSNIATVTVTIGNAKVYVPMMLR